MSETVDCYSIHPNLPQNPIVNEEGVWARCDMCDCGEANKNDPHNPCPIHGKPNATNKEVMDLIVRHMQDGLFKGKIARAGDGN
jgi:hypothetical protein